MPPEVVEAAWRNTRGFFSEPEEAKELDEIRMWPGDPYGYVPLGGEKLSAGKQHELGTEDDEVPGDLNESFSIGPMTEEFGAPPTKWPASPAGFRRAWAAYYTAMELLSRTLLRGFALGLDLPEDWFVDKVDRHRCALRTLNYPELAPDNPALSRPGQLRASAHTDYGTMTLLLQGVGGEAHAGNGLQVMAGDGRSGDWREVPYTPGSFVVNLGDLMSRWTNTRWVSTLHRVVMPSGDRPGSLARRQSMAFFHNINPDQVT